MAQRKSLTKTLLREVLVLAVGELAESVENIAREVKENAAKGTSGRQMRQMARLAIDAECDRLEEEVPRSLRNLALELAVQLLKG